MKNYAIASLFLFLGLTAISAQNYKPAAEFESLMNMRFYEATGGFMVHHVQLVFPPASVGKAAVVVTQRGGGVVATAPLRYEKMEFPAFGSLVPASGESGIFQIGKTGDYVMSVVVDGQTLSSMPFSLKEENSSDPFNPVKRFVRSGPWPDLAFLKVVPDGTDQQLTFSWWSSTRELPAGLKQGSITVHLMNGGKEIAASQGTVVQSTMDWTFYDYKQLSVPGVPRAHWMTLGDLQKLSGDVTIVLKANGTPFKTYKLTVNGGQVQRLPENDLNYEPHTAWISPRYIDQSSGTNSQYKMYEMYWLRAVK